MNGRIYDPRIGRFLTADPVIDGVFSTQGMNRYSYVGNNPLAYTDPDGLFKFKSLFKAIFVIAAVATLQFEVLPVALAQAGMAAATIPLASAVTAGAIGGLISGGDLQSMVIGAVSAGMLHGVGGALGDVKPFTVEHLVKVAANAVIGCAQSAASGGRCAPAAMAAGFASFAGPLVPNMGAVGNTVAQAVIGGVTAKLGGGKFENGAVTAAFGYLFSGALGGIDSVDGIEGDVSPDDDGVQIAACPHGPVGPKCGEQKIVEGGSVGPGIGGPPGTSGRFDQTRVGKLFNDLNTWLGGTSGNVRVITNQSGDKIFMNEQAGRRVQFHLNETRPHESPHMHIDSIRPNGQWKNSPPIYPSDVPPK